MAASPSYENCLNSCEKWLEKINIFNKTYTVIAHPLTVNLLLPLSCVFPPLSIPWVNPSVSKIVYQRFRKFLNCIRIFVYQQVWHFFYRGMFYLFIYVYIMIVFDLLGTMLVCFYVFGIFFCNTPIYLTLVKWWNTGHLTTKPSVALSSEDFFMISKRQMVRKL